jgi:hypothetical protein
MYRVGASVNAKTGELRLHLKANYVVNTLGTKYSIPKPGSRGRYEGELLLREDQLLSGLLYLYPLLCACLFSFAYLGIVYCNSI